MKRQWKGFISGILVCIMFLSLIVTAYAAYQKSATLNYADIKITLDGQAIIPADANGNPVEPFIIEGTTYLPVRAVANALGLEVAWDQATKTVKLTHPGATSEQPATQQKPGADWKPVGDPGVEVSMDTSILGGPLSAKVNSADGIKLLWIARNNSGKTINYYTAHLSFLNRVGDPAYDEITGKSVKTVKVVGPVAPGGDLLIYSIVGYSATCSKIIITDIDLEYSDGTKETVSYGFATPEF